MTDTLSGYTPLQGSSKTKKPRILRADFGDGYTQRATDGINTNRDRWVVKFRCDTSGEADTFEAFLVAHGSDAFYWTPPREGTPKLWTVESWTRTPEDSPDTDLFSCNFVQEFDAYAA